MNLSIKSIPLLLTALLLFSCKKEKAVDTAQLRQEAHSEETVMTEELDFLIRPTNASVMASIDSVQPKRMSQEGRLNLDGTITYDTRNVFTIPARVAGRIEQLYVKYNFQPVKKGQKLLEIYSPELVTAQKELLFLLENDSGNELLLQGAKQKLRLLGASEGQISQLIKNRKEHYAISIYSPYNGYVTLPGATQPQTGISAQAPARASGGMDGMGGSTPSVTPSATPVATPQEFNLREGMYVGAGQTLFQVINGEQLWAEFNVPVNALQTIEKGTPLTISIPQVSDKAIQTTVDLVQPFFASGENFAKIRARIPSQKNLTLAGQLVQAQATYTIPPALWVPQEAVLDIGSTKVVFQKMNGAFIPVAVQAGQTLDDMVEIVSGLDEQDMIAANAQFLVDSESFIRVRE